MNAYFAIGYTCNHHCIFCPCGKNVSRNGALTDIEFEEYINKAIQDKNIRSITISGGEPTIQPAFLDILKVLSRKSIHVAILTNSDVLSNKEKVTRIAEISSPRQVRFITALHSPIPQEHDEMTNTKGSFQRSLDGIKNLCEFGYDVTVKHIINQISYKKIPDFVDLTFREFSQKVSLLFCGMDFCGVDLDTANRLKVGFKELGPFLEAGLDKVIAYGESGKQRKTTITDIPLCSVDPYYWGFFSYASKFSLSAYASPVMLNSEHSKLKLDVESDCGTFFKGCQNCKVQEICPGTWKTACKILGENEISPIDVKL